MNKHYIGDTLLNYWWEIGTIFGIIITFIIIYDAYDAYSKDMKTYPNDASGVEHFLDKSFSDNFGWIIVGVIFWPAVIIVGGLFCIYFIMSKIKPTLAKVLENKYKNDNAEDFI